MAVRCLKCHQDKIAVDTQNCPSCGVHLPSLLRDLLPEGTLLRGGTYRLEHALGQGGFGITYQATHVALNSLVAIKEFYPQGFAFRDGTNGVVSVPSTQANVYERSLNRFLHEGRILARLTHPNVVRVQDLFQERATAYLVMELIPGTTLRAELDAQPAGHLTAERCFYVTEQLVDALSAIHEAGVCHLDIKPGNILIDNQRIVLADFGAARQNFGPGTTTQPYTLDYAAPEVVAGVEVGPQADVFEMGMMLHEMLTGTLPPASVSRLSRGSLRNWQPTLLEEPWMSLVVEALRLDKDERPTSARLWWSRPDLPQPGVKSAPSRAPSADMGRRDANPEWSGMLGRQDVVARLTEICARVLVSDGTDASGVSCLLNAAGGQGRSVVLREVVARLRSRRINVALAVPQSGDPFPLRGVCAALGGDLDHLASRLRHGGPRAAAQVLSNALESCTQPTILVADDFTRMGDTTEQVLRALASLEPPPGKGWLLSFSGNPCPGAECVELPPLEADKILFLAQKELAGPIEEGLQQWLLSKAEASVRRLRLYLHVLQSNSSIVLCNGSWKWADSVIPPTEYVGPILSTWTIPQLRLLRTVCLLDDPFPIEVAIRAAGLAEDEADRSVDRLCRAGVLEECWGPAGQHFQLASSEIKESVLRGLPDRAKKVRHSDIVEALGECAPVTQRAPHEAQAQLSPESMAHLIEGAEQLGDWGAFSEATRLWTLAQELVRHLELEEWRWRIEAGVAESLWRGGQIEEALAMVERASRQPPPASAEALSHYHTVTELVARLSWLKAKRPEETLKCCLQLAERVGPDSLWLTLTQGEALEALGKRSEALRTLNALAAKNGQSLPVLYYLLRGRLLRNLHCFDDSMACVEKALSRTDELSVDEFYALRWELAECHLGLGDVATARSSVDDAIGFCLSSRELAWEKRFRELRGRCREGNECTRPTGEPAAGDLTEDVEECLDPPPAFQSELFQAPTCSKEADSQPGLSKVSVLSDVGCTSEPELSEAALPTQPGAVFEETAASLGESSPMFEAHPRPRRVLYFVIAALALAVTGYALKGQSSPIASPVATVRSDPTSSPPPVLSPPPTPASDYLNSTDGSLLVTVPAGEFFMGASPNDKVANPDEKPGRTVRLEAYQIGKYEVTNLQYARFVDATGYVGDTSWLDNARKWGAPAPVVGVSWDDAQAYCNWAGLRLPSEAEWERAARGTDGRIYPWGNDWDASRAVSNTTTGPAGVGSKPAGTSPIGCLDMAGNVREWVDDWYEPEQESKVYRGGSWNFGAPGFLRCSCRNRGSLGTRDSGLGFRCARTPLLSDGAATLKPTATPTPDPKVDQALVVSPSPTEQPTYVNPRDGSVMVSVPAGEFFMGASPKDEDAQFNEKPGRTVRLAEYQICQYEVTNFQYAQFVKSTSIDRDTTWQKYANSWGERAPVIAVSWEDAQAYCDWAGLRLPSEAEWERAARGNDGRIYPWGNKWDPSLAVTVTTCPAEVGSKPAGISPAGCLDMAGNVWEWVDDWYEPEQKNKVIRGGGWGSGVFRNLRCSARGSFPRVYRDLYVGFRCARTP